MIRPQDLTNRVVNTEPEPAVVDLEHGEQRHEPIVEDGDEPRQPEDVPPPAEDVQPHDVESE